jgi:hypothetical protein
MYRNRARKNPWEEIEPGIMFDPDARNSELLPERDVYHNPVRHRSQMSGKQRKKADAAKSARSMAASQRRQANYSLDAMYEAQDDAWEGGEYQGRYAYPDYNNPSGKDYGSSFEMDWMEHYMSPQYAFLDAGTPDSSRAKVLGVDFSKVSDDQLLAKIREMERNIQGSAYMGYNWAAEGETQDRNVLIAELRRRRRNKKNPVRRYQASGITPIAGEEYDVESVRVVKAKSKKAALKQLRKGGRGIDDVRKIPAGHRPYGMAVYHPGAPDAGVQEFHAVSRSPKALRKRVESKGYQVLDQAELLPGTRSDFRLNPFFVTPGGQAVGAADYHRHEKRILDAHGSHRSLREFDPTRHKRIARGASRAESVGDRFHIKQVGGIYKIVDSEGNDTGRYAHSLDKAQYIIEKVLSNKY